MDGSRCQFANGVWCPVEAWGDHGFGRDLRPASVVVHASYGGEDTRYRCNVCGFTFLVTQLRAPDGFAYGWPTTAKERLMVELAWLAACGGVAIDDAGRRLGVAAPTAQRWVSAVLERFRGESRSLCVTHDHGSIARLREQRCRFLAPPGAARGDADASWHWIACAAEVLHRLREGGVIASSEFEASWSRVTRREAVLTEPWSAEVELLRSLWDVTSEAERLGLGRVLEDAGHNRLE